MKAKRAWALFRKGVGDFLEDDPFEKAAAVSYYTLLALAPLLLLVLALAGTVFEREAVEGQVVAEMRGLVGEEGAKAIELVIENARTPGQNVLSIALGVFMLLIGASGVFLQLQSALNRIWDVAAAPRRSALLQFLRHRLLSMAMVFVLGFLLLVSLILSAVLSAINAHYQTVMPWPAVWHGANALGSLLVITLLFATIYKVLPDVKLAWRDVWLGGLITAVLFTLGKFLIGAYIGRASIGSSYGAAGSVVVLVVWVYYASLIFFVGAEITQVYARWREGRIRPNDHAVVAPQQPPPRMHIRPG
jgi:membrane protein